MLFNEFFNETAAAESFAVTLSTGHTMTLTGALPSDDDDGIAELIGEQDAEKGVKVSAPKTEIIVTKAGTRAKRAKKFNPLVLSEGYRDHAETVTAKTVTAETAARIAI